MSLSYQIIFWRDIPAQVKVRSGSQRFNRALSPRFQEAIDEAAMRAHLTNTDDYLEEWRSSEWLSAEGDAEQFMDALVLQLEGDYPSDRLHRLKLNEGREIIEPSTGH